MGIDFYCFFCGKSKSQVQFLLNIPRVRMRSKGLCDHAWHGYIYLSTYIYLCRQESLAEEKSLLQ